MTAVAKDYGYKDGSGVYQVVKRLEANAKNDRVLAKRIKDLKQYLSRVVD